MIEELNRVFGLGDEVRFSASPAGWPIIEIDSSVCRARISLYGAQLLSFMPAGQSEDLLYLSPRAYFEHGRAIKGGIPICWPWFGNHSTESDLPAHGFVRTCLWQVESIHKNEQQQIVVALGTRDTPESLSLWPHAFRLTLVMRFSKSLSLELITENTGKSRFTLSQALHTYFNVGDIQATEISGLLGCAYLDKVEDYAVKTQQTPLTFAAQTDRIYQQVSYPLEIMDGGRQRRILIDAQGSQTAVVWNPWQALSKTSADLPDEAYLHFVCVETANAAEDTVILEAGESRVLQTNYNVMDLTKL